MELRDARHLWGLTTRETERRLKLELNDEENVSVACIGLAGEAELPGAMVKAARNRGAGEGSPGAIMGSKGLKAIAVRGTGSVPLFDAQGLTDTAAEWEENLASTSPWLQDGGITRNYYDPWGKSLRVAAKNMTDPLWGAEFARKYVEACSRWRINPMPSYNCKISSAGPVEKVVWCQTWAEALAELAGTHGPGTRVGVYPYAPPQVPARVPVAAGAGRA